MKKMVIQKDLSYILLFIFVGCSYTILAIKTEAYYQADTWIYIEQIVKAQSETELLEFGHLFWRPIVKLVYQALLFFSILDDKGDFQLQLFQTLLIVNWIAGIVAVCALTYVTNTLTRNTKISGLTVGILIISNAYLNFIHTGSPYILGLSLLLLSLAFQVHFAVHHKKAIAYLSAVCLAGSVLIWFLYALTFIYCTVFSFHILSNNKQIRKQALLIGGSGFLLVLLGYITAFFLLHLHSHREIIAWVSASSHGIELSGVQRAIFGLPKLLIYAAQDGVLIKRYLLHDPFNPVAFEQLLITSLWKVLLFYLVLFSIVFYLISKKAWREAGVFLTNAIPILLFASFFDGAATERFLPLLPGLLILITDAFVRLWHIQSVRIIIACLFLGLFIANYSAASKERSEEERRKVEAELQPIVPKLTPIDRIITLNLDDLLDYKRNYPQRPLSKIMNLYWLVELGTPSVHQWRKNFASTVKSTWKHGGKIWMRRLLMLERPIGTNWVEGADPYLRWRDFKEVLNKLEVDSSYGTYYLLLPSGHNRAILNEFLFPKSNE